MVNGWLRAAVKFDVRYMRVAHIVEIIILAMVAAFLGLRLYSVLGQRSEQEEESVPTRFERGDSQPRVVDGRDKASTRLAGAPSSEARILGVAPVLERPLRAIAAADRDFDMLAFIAGAKSAYGMILEAFWNSDRETLRELTDDEVYAGFASAIDAREEAGETFDNRLIRIEEATIQNAELDGRIARITVRFAADIAAVTRDADGQVVAGSLDDAIDSTDIWTFARDVRSAAPAWQLVETDEG